MSEPEKDAAAPPADRPGMFRVVCPCCHSVLWVDPEIREVIRSEKGRKPKGDLDELLSKEKKRQAEFDHRFDAGFDLQRKRQERAAEIFESVLSKADAEEDGEAEGDDAADEKS